MIPLRVKVISDKILIFILVKEILFYSDYLSYLNFMISGIILILKKLKSRF